MRATLSHNDYFVNHFAPFSPTKSPRMCRTGGLPWSRGIHHLRHSPCQDEHMATREEAGPFLAVGIAIPFWVERLLGSWEFDWASAFVSAACLAYAALAWLSVIYDSEREFWHGSALATTRWVSLAGFTALPAVVLGLHGVGLAVVTAVVTASVFFLSPELSALATETLERLFGVERTVPPSERGTVSTHEYVSSWEAVRLCPPGRLVPPCWHPCLGQPTRILRGSTGLDAQAR